MFILDQTPLCQLNTHLVIYLYHQSWIVKVFHLIVGTTLGVFGFIGFVFIFVLFFFPFLITFNNQIDHNDKIGLLDKT